MARTIATVSGTALVPGVSRNGRWYTRETIARAVARAQQRIAEGGTLDLVRRDLDAEPMSQLTHHAAEDDSTRVVGRVTALRLAEDGSARFDAAIADTPHARAIASLLDTSDGEPPFLKGVSIRGAWLGKVRRVQGPSGVLVERGDDLELDGLDYTRKPGVTGAQVDAFAWVADGAPESTETSERVLITESVQEAHVTTITEETTGTGPGTPGAPAELREAFSVIFGGMEIDEAGTPALSQRDSGLSGGGRRWADPGYQADKKQRYDLTTKAKAKAAWSYISQGDNAKAYTAAQLKRIKGRIKTALKGFGVQVAAEGWTIDSAFQVTETIAEYMGDPDTCGSYSLSATNGPTTVTICSYGLDPADLRVILAKACEGASVAMCTLDPDMDGDIDVPGADADDTDGDADDLASRLAAAIRGESAEDLDALVTEARAACTTETAVTETAVSESPAATEDAANPGTEAPAVSETTTQEAAPATAAPSFSQADIDTAVQRALDADRAARRARKAAKARPAEAAPAAAVTETAPPSEEDRINAIVEAQLAKAGLAPVTETDEERINRIAEERVTARIQELAASGQGPARKGLVTEHSAARAAAEIPAGLPFGDDGKVKARDLWTEDETRAVGEQLENWVLAPRAARG